MPKKQVTNHTPYQPEFARVLIAPVEAPGQVGSIIIPESHKDKPTTGVILALGPWANAHELERPDYNFAVGDEVVFGKYSGTSIEYMGKELVVLHVSDILARVEK